MAKLATRIIITLLQILWFSSWGHYCNIQVSDTVQVSESRLDFFRMEKTIRNEGRGNNSKNSDSQFFSFSFFWNVCMCEEYLQIHAFSFIFVLDSSNSTQRIGGCKKAITSSVCVWSHLHALADSTLSLWMSSQLHAYWTQLPLLVDSRRFHEFTGKNSVFAYQ